MILWSNLVNLYFLFCFKLATSLSYDFIEYPGKTGDSVVYDFDSKSKDQGFAILNCSFNPPFDSVSWQYVAVDSDSKAKSLITDSKWADIFIDGKSHFIHDNDSLKVSAWNDQSDSKTRRYRCIGNIRNWGSVISPAGKVTVAVPPYAVSSGGPTNSKEYENGLLKLFCPVKATPHPAVTWFKNDIKLFTTPRISTMPPSDFSTAALEISNLQLRDQGIYSCEGSNLVGDKRVYVSQLDVIKGHTSEGLQFYISPSNLSALVGEDVVLQCAARGFPTSIKYTWYRDNVPLPDGASDGKYAIIGSGNIKVKQVNLKDTGKYKCIATVSGMVEAKSQDPIHLQINEAPRFSIPTMDSFIQIQGEEHGSVVLPCPVVAHPAPSVSWYVDKKPLKVDGIYFVQEPDSMQIYGLLISDSRIYECVAENDYGSVYRIFHLSVLPKSPTMTYTSISQPLMFEAESTTINSVTLSWKPPGAQRNDLVRYLISYHEKNSKFPRVKKVTILKDKTTLEIGSLQEDTLYEFSVQGVNSNNDLGQMATTRVKTLRRTLLGDITVSVQQVQAKNALIEWKVVSSSYNTFQLEYVTSCFTNSPRASRVTTAYKSYLLQNLEESCRYNVTVSSGNSQGQVALGSTYFETLPAIPSAAPEDVRAMGIDPRKIEVWWAEVPKKDQNGKITQYIVRYRPERMKKVVNTETISAEEGTHVVLSGLDKDSVYQISVAAASSVDIKNPFGPYSDWISAKTLVNTLTEDRVPGKVKSLSVVDVTDSTITIKWEGTQDGETIRVRSYVLYIDQMVPINVEAVVPATDDRFTFTNLKVNKNYIIKMAAKNNIGNGPDSLVYQRTAEAPSVFDMPLQMPNNVSVRAISHDTLQVSFTSNNPTKDDSWYKVRVTWRYPTVFTQEFDCRPPLTLCSVTGLRPGTEYEIDVKAYRGAPGDPNAISSPWSMTAQGRTLETVPASAPTDLTSSTVTAKPNNVLLMWMAPSEPNGAITGYDLSYTTDPSAKDWALDHVLGNVLAHEVKDLTLQTTYYFKIAARNKKGLGPSSAPLSYTTPAVGTNGGSFGSQGEERDNGRSGGLDKEYFYIMIAGVVGITVIVVCLIIAFVVCRIINHQAAASIIDKQSVLGRPESSLTQQGSLYAAAGKQTQLQQPDVTDLYVHKDQLMEMKIGKDLSLTYMPAGSGSQLSNGINDFMRSGSPPDINKHLMTTNFSMGAPSPSGYPQMSMTPQSMMHLQSNPSPNVLKQMQLNAMHEMQQSKTLPSHHQQPNLIRPTPVRMGAHLPPPLSQHPHSMHSDVPTMAIKPMLMSTSNHTTPTPMSNSPHCYSGGSMGQYKHYECDNMGDYNGSDNAVYSPPSSLSGGNMSRDGSLGRSNKYHNSDKALKALPSMPPELKPLSSLSSPTGPVLPIASMHNQPSNQYLQMQGNLPPSSVSMIPPVSSAHYRPPTHPRMGTGGINQPAGMPNEFYNHSVMQQEADACVDRIAGLMNKLNSGGSHQNHNNQHGYPFHVTGEMDC
ncbi:neogenin-like [Symsagittifera roscoffensis]|uniref:neogenin-like n=1 Tax=Symsagittifera roscoffensis TaxID=84072 RepID=UPI00307BD44D